MASASKVDVWNRALSLIGHTEKVEPAEEEEGGSTAAEQCRLHWDDIVAEAFAAYRWPWAKKQAVLSQIDEQVSDDEAGDGVITTFNIPFEYTDPSLVLVEKILISSGAATELVIDTDYTLTAKDEDTDAPAYVTPVVLVTASYAIRITVTTTREGWLHAYLLPADCITPMWLLAVGDRSSLQAWDSRYPFEIVANAGGTGQLLLTDLDTDDFDAIEYISLIDHIPAWPRLFLQAVVHRLAAELGPALKGDTKLGITHMQLYDEIADRAYAQSMNLGSRTEPETPTLVAMK